MPWWRMTSISRSNISSMYLYPWNRSPWKLSETNFKSASFVKLAYLVSSTLISKNSGWLWSYPGSLRCSKSSRCPFGGSPKRANTLSAASKKVSVRNCSPLPEAACFSGIVQSLGSSLHGHIGVYITSLCSLLRLSAPTPIPCPSPNLMALSTDLSSSISHLRAFDSSCIECRQSPSAMTSSRAKTMTPRASSSLRPALSTIGARWIKLVKFLEGNEEPITPSTSRMQEQRT
mmetsp:Transcript_14784/g.23021  ORF Transcript_14784/g.23021 Transcript_14784/m.23021 type:complete len:232 (-) Transcript_14784:1756-2451(-)